MVSAATAAVAVLVMPLVRDHGVDYLFAATIQMGIIQIVAGLLRLDLVMQFVSRSVITGFVNALAILIFLAQLPQLTNVGWQTYAMAAGGLAIIYGFPRITKAIPSPLVAILVLSAISIGMGLPVNTVGDMGRLPEGLPSLALSNVPLTLDTLRIILPYSLTMIQPTGADRLAPTRCRRRMAPTRPEVALHYHHPHTAAHQRELPQLARNVRIGRSADYAVTDDRSEQRAVPRREGHR